MTAPPASAAWAAARLARLAARLVRVVVLAAVAVVLLPVAVVVAVGVMLAWRRGWRPARLYRAAGWCVPVVVVWLVVMLLVWHPLGLSGLGGLALWAMPVAVPLGLLAAGRAWAARLASMASGAGGRSPMTAARFDERQWRHQVRAARARASGRRGVPLLSRRGDFVAGTVIRAAGHVQGGLLELPASRLRAHQIVIGGTGSGKSTLMLRLWAGFMASAAARHAAGQAGPPLLIVLDCKGGADSRRHAERTKRVLSGAGASKVAVWPDAAALSLWDLRAGQLVTALVDLVEHGSGGAAYYTDVLEAAVTLAVQAPPGPPANSAGFLDRLEPGWLQAAYAASPGQAALAVPAGRQLSDIALRFRAVFRRLGPGLDGPGSLADADAFYCILEGTSQVRVAEAQARALVDLIASFVTAAGQPARQVLLAVDEFSAVSRRVPIWQLFERARSLGLAVQVSAQSWHGLAAHDDDRYRLAATAEGGTWLLRTAYPDPVTALAGQQPGADTTRQLDGELSWPGAGSTRLGPAPVADPERFRRLDTGQAGYLYRGGVTFVQVKQLDTAPAAAAVEPARTAGAETSGPAGDETTSPPPTPAGATPASPAAAPLPDISEFLDEVFGIWP